MTPEQWLEWVLENLPAFAQSAEAIVALILEIEAAATPAAKTEAIKALTAKMHEEVAA